MGFLVGANGLKSSKRLLGIVTLAIALLLSITLEIMAIFHTIKNPEVAMTVLQYLMMGGCTLLGVGVFEAKINKR